ncbi:MAG: hypothetical protein OXE85_10240 [Roseovarius sp.]|nr:hypothetical protein [Roseovarius sp.]
MFKGQRTPRRLPKQRGAGGFGQTHRCHGGMGVASRGFCFGSIAGMAGIVDRTGANHVMTVK